MKHRIWLKQLRLDKGMTQQKVSDQLDITLRYYQMMEQGIKTPSVKVAKEIGKLLNFDWNKFYEGEGNEEKFKIQ